MKAIEFFVEHTDLCRRCASVLLIIVKKEVVSINISNIYFFLNSKEFMDAIFTSAILTVFEFRIFACKNI